MNESQTINHSITVEVKVRDVVGFSHLGEGLGQRIPEFGFRRVEPIASARGFQLCKVDVDPLSHSRVHGQLVETVFQIQHLDRAGWGEHRISHIGVEEYVEVLPSWETAVHVVGKSNEDDKVSQQASRGSEAPGEHVSLFVKVILHEASSAMAVVTVVEVVQVAFPVMLLQGRGVHVCDVLPSADKLVVNECRVFEVDERGVFVEDGEQRVAVLGVDFESSVLRANDASLKVDSSAADPGRQ